MGGRGGGEGRPVAALLMLQGGRVQTVDASLPGVTATDVS